MGILENANAIPTAAAAADFYTYQIANSCRFDGTSYLTDTRASDGSATTGTISFWFKRSGMGEYGLTQMTAWQDGNNGLRVQYLADDTLEFRNETSGSVTHELETTQVFRDPSAWYHFVGIIDYTNGTQADRAQMWINGERVTAFETETYPSDASQTMVLNTGAYLRWGSSSDGGYSTEGYMAECVVIDGTAEAATDFGESKNGVWIPKDPSGLTFGTNGVYLKYESSGDMGNDSSGNNHDFALTNILATDQMKDTPTFGSSSGGGNFCTFNPLNTTPDTGTTLSEGNLATTAPSSGSFEPVFSSFYTPRSGKWYCEMRTTQGGSSIYGKPSVFNRDKSFDFDDDFYGGGTGITGVQFNTNDGTKRINNSDTAYGSAVSAGDIVQIALDIDNGAIYFGINNTWQNSGDPTSGASKTGAALTADVAGAVYGIIYARYNGGTADVWNFGSDSSFANAATEQGNTDGNSYGDFYYTPPTDFLALCSGNLTTATDPASDEGPYKYFVPKLYTGDGASTLAITGLEFQPDFTWIKNRDAADSYCLFDSIRGVTEVLSSDSNAVESTDADTLKSWTSDGFTVGADVKVNTNTEDYVSWNWKGGGASSSNEEGDVTTTVSADTDRGFSIVKYTASGSSNTFGHGLGAVPDFIIQKNYSDTWNWRVYHKDLTSGYYLQLNGTNAQFSATEITALSTTTVTLASGGNFNYQSGDLNIMYCFANKEGYSSFGTYEGNGNADGPFVYTGFKPRLLVLKRIDGLGSWLVSDSARRPNNDGTYRELYWNSTSDEQTGADSHDGVNYFSNGFKLKATNAGANGSGNDYVYIAFAENPFKYATAF